MLLRTCGGDSISRSSSSSSRSLLLFRRRYRRGCCRYHRHSVFLFLIIASTKIMDISIPLFVLWRTSTVDRAQGHTSTRTADSLIDFRLDWQSAWYCIVIVLCCDCGSLFVCLFFWFVTLFHIVPLDFKNLDSSIPPVSKKRKSVLR